MHTFGVVRYTVDDTIHEVPLPSGHIVLDATFPVPLADLSAAFLGRSRNVTVVMNRPFSTALPTWLIHADDWRSEVELYELPTGSCSWPLLSDFLRSALGSTIRRAELATQIGESLTALLPPGPRSFGKFLNFNGFSATVDDDAMIEVKKIGLDPVINSFFQSSNDRPILYFAINRAVRRLLSQSIELPLIVHRIPPCLAVDKVLPSVFTNFIRSMTSQSILLAR